MDDMQAPSIFNNQNRPRLQTHRGGGPQKEAKKAHVKQKTSAHSTQKTLAHSTQRPGNSNSNFRGRDPKKSNHNTHNSDNTHNTSRDSPSGTQRPAPQRNNSSLGTIPKIQSHGTGSNENWVQYKDKRGRHASKGKYGNINKSNTNTNRVGTCKNQENNVGPVQSENKSHELISEHNAPLAPLYQGLRRTYIVLY